MFLHDCISTDKHSKYFSNPRILEYMDYVIVFCGIALSLRANKISENYLGFFPPSRGKGEKNHAQAVQLRMWSCKLEKQKEVGQCQKSGHCAYHIGFMHLGILFLLKVCRDPEGGLFLIISSQFRKMFSELSAKMQILQLELHQW